MSCGSPQSGNPVENRNRVLELNAEHGGWIKSTVSFSSCHQTQASAHAGFGMDPLDSYVGGLMDACPCGGDPGRCPLHGARAWDPEQRRHWVQSLSEEDKRFIAVYHWTCMELTLLDQMECGESCDY